MAWFMFYVYIVTVIIWFMHNIFKLDAMERAERKNNKGIIELKYAVYFDSALDAETVEMALYAERLEFEMMDELHWLYNSGASADVLYETYSLHRRTVSELTPHIAVYNKRGDIYEDL